MKTIEELEQEIDRISLEIDTLKRISKEIDTLKRISKEIDTLKSLPNPKMGQVWNDASDGNYIVSHMREVGYFAVFEDGMTSGPVKDLDEFKRSIIEDGNYFVSERATIEGVDA